jgi:hypothetical protein
MEEARRVLARLERIETLERGNALPQTLLTELRALLAEAEDWARAEREAPESALDAVERCRRALQGAGRTLLA